MAGEKIKEVMSPVIIRGIGVGSGIAIAPLRFDPVGSEAGENLLLLERAAEGARHEILALREQAVKNVGEEHGEIFDLHLSMLSDSDLMDFIKGRIENGEKLASAIEEARERFARTDEMEDRPKRAMAAHVREVLELLRESAEDAVNDVKKEKLHPVGEKRKADEKYILVSPGEREDFIFGPDTKSVVGIVLVGGSENSGLAAFARAKGIPALVVSEADAPDVKLEGSGAIIDPARNRLTVNPDLAALDKFTESSRLSEEREQRLAALIGKPSVTRSGSYISVFATVDEGEGAAALSADAEGIGIFKTEHLFGEESEESQFEEYKKALEIFKGKPVIVRAYSGGRGSEMGQRGIRFCLAEREAFKEQIRAVLRAAALGELYLALPMAVSPEEIRRARTVMAESASELKGRGTEFGEPRGVGAVIDTPAAALNAERLAAESDFFVADTDRLLTFTLGADRGDACLSELIKRNPDPVIKLIGYSSKMLHASGKGKLMGVAGDLAADLSLTEGFVSLGADFLSVPPPYVLEVREKIRECP